MPIPSRESARSAAGPQTPAFLRTRAPDRHQRKTICFSSQDRPDTKAVKLGDRTCAIRRIEQPTNRKPKPPAHHGCPSAHLPASRRCDFCASSGKPAMRCDRRSGRSSSSRCQTTRASMAKPRQHEFGFHGRPMLGLKTPAATSVVALGFPAHQRGRPFGLASPFGLGIAPCGKRPGGTKRSLVEPDGIEPTTSCLQSTRSPN